jgi:hypothetical protein
MEPITKLISIAALHGPNSIQAAHELHLRLGVLRSTLSPGAANLLDYVVTLAARRTGRELHRPNSVQAAHELYLRLRMLRSTLSSGAANLLDNVLTLAAKGKGKRKGGKGQQEFLIIKMNDLIVTGVT